MQRIAAVPLALAGALLLGHALAAHAAYEFYVTMEGTKQGKFKGESARDAYKQTMPGLAFSYEVKAPRDMATNQPVGKRLHGALTFTKEWGPATPQIFQAVTTNEVLKSVLFQFMKTRKDGTQYVYQTIKLTNATVAGVKWHAAQTDDADSAKHAQVMDTRELEDISLTFQKIEVENLDGKTMAADDWHQ